VRAGAWAWAVCALPLLGFRLGALFCKVCFAVTALASAVMELGLVSVCRCTNYLRHDVVVPIDAEFMVDQQRVYQRLAGEGMRVLGFARGLVPARPLAEYVFTPGCTPDSHVGELGREGVSCIVDLLYSCRYTAEDAVLPIANLDFIAMTGLTDPPKDGVPEAIVKCREAGIRVFMVTGDHPFTAEAIARQVCSLFVLVTASASKLPLCASSTLPAP
jgi:magnesium-transporting ATPase (P-type)